MDLCILFPCCYSIINISIISAMHATIEINENSNYNKDSAVVATIKNEELVEKEEKKKEGSDKRQGRGADNNKDNSNDMTITMTLPQ